MTEEKKKTEEQIEMEKLREQYPSIEEQPEHPGWVTLAEVFQKAETSEKTDPFFENLLFMLGYDFSCNIYVLKGDYLTVVDPGNDYTGFMELFKLGYKPENIQKIVLTHGHRDHSMGALELLRAYPEITESGGFEIIFHESGPEGLKKVIEELKCRVSLVKGGETLELSGFE